MKKRKLFWIALATLAAVTIWTGVSLEAEDWSVTSARIPEAFDGLRITLLTDLHGAELGQNHQRLLDAVARAQPDLIAISGDLADEHTDTATLTPLLTALTQLAPTCYVTGNHEWARDDTEALLQQIAATGVTVLRNSYVTLERNGAQLVLAGAEDPMAYADQETPEELVARIRQEVGGDPYLVMLAHRNDRLAQWAALDVDLVLSGHGHGGVIRLPFVGGLFGVDRSLFPDNAEGLYHQGRTTLAVSRGLGGLRLWNRPHLPTIVLNRK